ncbi:MAG: glycoside hydrolase family 16 protein [Parafilimonas sp.]
MKKILFIFISIIIFSCSKQSAQILSTQATDNSTTSTIQFSGYTWNVKNGSHLGPGPNYWSRNNVWVDAKGFLHLKITKDSVTGKWYCAEVSTQQTFGFGKWQFWVDGRIDKMDKNVVLGLFNYSGNDGFDEMDIEWARWGNKHYPNCNYTVWPAEKGFKNYSYVKEVSLTGKNTTQRFTRTDSSVFFQSIQGFTNGNDNVIASSHCKAPEKSISSLPMPAYINLWLMNGMPPANEKEVEIIIHKFSYTP